MHWENELPPIDAIYERGGEPGKQYAYVSAERAVEAQRAGLRHVPGAPVFSLSGPGGTQQWMVMEMGDAIPGLRPEASRAEVLCDDRLKAILRPREERLTEAPAEQSVQAESEAPEPAPSKTLYRVPCGREWDRKTSAHSHYIRCRDERCRTERLAGRKVDAFEVRAQ